jgi:hypothetical protein
MMTILIVWLITGLGVAWVIGRSAELGKIAGER